MFIHLPSADCSSRDTSAGHQKNYVNDHSLPLAKRGAKRMEKDFVPG